MERFLSFDGQKSRRKFPLPLCQCGNLYSTTMWFALIAVLGGKCCVGISVSGMGCVETNI
jgi:hypothetical protein